VASVREPILALFACACSDGKELESGLPHVTRGTNARSNAPGHGCPAVRLRPASKDLRPLPLGERKTKLEKLLAGAAAGIVFNEHTDENGAIVFEHACRFGFEGIVSKRLTAPYRSGPSQDWIKVKNPVSPAMIRHRGGSW
jgi:hypothetical protein